MIVTPWKFHNYLHRLFTVM